jgi:hypothetical protein
MSVQLKVAEGDKGDFLDLPADILVTVAARVDKVVAVLTA